MADRPTRTKASPPPRSGSSGSSGGGEKKIAGMKQSTVFIVGGLALGGGLLYFYFKGKQTPQGQGQGGQKKQRPTSPTGLTREQFVLHIQDHHGHKRGRAG